MLKMTDTFPLPVDLYNTTSTQSRSHSKVLTVKSVKSISSGDTNKAPPKDVK